MVCGQVVAVSVLSSMDAIIFITSLSVSVSSFSFTFSKLFLKFFDSSFC